MTESTTVRVEHDERVTIVTIDRPEARNAVDRPTSERSPTPSTSSTRTTITMSRCSPGRTACSARAPTSRRISGGQGVPVREEGDGPMGPTRMLLDKPVIAAVEGYAVAGGLELALWCDLRVAATDAVFGVFCRRWGVPLIDGGTVRLPRLIGQSHALDLILTGRGVSGEEALRMGLANRLTEPAARSRPRSASRKSSPRSRNVACAPIACPRTSSGTSRSPKRCATSTDTASAWSPHGDMLEGVSRFVGGAGRHGRPGGLIRSNMAHGPIC